MKFSIFADESGTHDGTKCYTIGAVVIPNNRLNRFEKWLKELKRRHGVNSEIKWSGIRNSHGAINLGIDLFKTFLKLKIQMGFIVVWKEHYRKWLDNKENAFYCSYSMLVQHVLKSSKFPHQVFIDDRSDSYDKHDEAMQIIVNNMLSQIKSDASLTEVQKTDSKAFAGIQAIDLITGAINSAHNCFLNPHAHVNRGKNILIKKLSEIIGWDNLYYDTFPFTNPNPNIWHFPKNEFRAVPASKYIQVNLNVDYIKPEDLSEA